MAATKAEIIEALYKAGKITFQEAMTLSAQEGKPIEPTMYEGAQQGQENLRAIARRKEEIIEEYLDEITDHCYDDKEDPEHKQNMAFDIDCCVEAMDANDWKWVTGQIDEQGGFAMETVDHDRFRKDLRSFIRNVIDQIIEKRQRNDPKDRENGFESFYGTGGIEVTGWIEEEKDGKERLVVHPRFVLEDVEADLDPDKFAELLK